MDVRTELDTFFIKLGDGMRFTTNSAEFSVKEFDHHFKGLGKQNYEKLKPKAKTKILMAYMKAQRKEAGILDV